MDEAWKTLVAAGVPDGPSCSREAVMQDAPTLRAALAAVLSTAGGIDPRRREPLLAWLRGWKHHGPRRFSNVLGPGGEQAIERFARDPSIHPNRYLKLRRIAIEHLAHARPARAGRGAVASGSAR